MKTTLNVTIGADISGLQRSLRSASGALKDFGDRMESLGSGLTSRLTLPIAGFGAAALVSAGRLEQLEKGLAAVMDEGADVAAEMKRLEKTAKLPGLGFAEAIQGSTRLQAVGFSAEGARRTLEAFSNAVATVGGGKAELSGVTLALTQIAAKGKVSAEEINQLQERLPQVRAAMQNAFGTADTEALADLGVSAEDFVTRLVAEFGKLPPVTGGLTNAFENFSESAGRSLAAVGKALDKSLGITPALEALAGRLSLLTEGFSALAEANPRLVRLGALLAGVAAAIGPALGSIGVLSKVLGVATAAIAAITSPIGLTILALAAVGGAIALLYRKSETFRDTVGAVWEGVRVSVSSAVEAAASAVQSALAAMQEFWSEYGGRIVRIASNVFGVAARIVGALIAGIADHIGLILNLLTGNWSAAFEGMKRIALRALKLIGGSVLSLADNVLTVNAALAKFIPVVGEGLARKLDEAAEAVAGLRAKLDGLGRTELSAPVQAVRQVGAAAAEADEETGGLFDSTKKLLGAQDSGAGGGIQRSLRTIRDFADGARDAIEVLIRKAGGLATIEFTASLPTIKTALGKDRIDGSGLTLRGTAPVLAEVTAATQRTTLALSELQATIAAGVAGAAASLTSGLIDGFAEALSGVRSFEDALSGIGDLLKRVLAQIVAALIKLALFRVLSGVLTGGAGTVGGAVLGALGGNLSSAATATFAGAQQSSVMVVTETGALLGMIQQGSALQSRAGGAA